MSKSVIIGGFPGTGSTTVASLVAKELGFTHVYGGGIFREMAKEAGQSLEEFNQTAKQDTGIDRELDDRLVASVRQGSTVVEGRMPGWLTPSKVPAWRVWLTCELAERVRRVTHRDADEDALAKMALRERLESERYHEYYGVDMDDLSVYDQVVDTTNIPADAVARQVLEGYQGH